MDSAIQIRKIAFLGDYPPRKCGIATFTSDLRGAIARQYPLLQCPVVSVNDQPEGYDYPAEVRFELPVREIESYRQAADFLNLLNIDVLSVQHEFGIYGGAAGSHLLAFLKAVRMPVVTTLHTILRDPDPIQQKVFDELTKRSARLVVMAEKGAEFLRDIYGVPNDKIDFIPHGIPDVPFIDPAFFKDQFGVEGRQVLLTFGLLSPNKGIENMIHALPRIVEKFPDVVYIVLGATHPALLRNEGETYRLSLERLVKSYHIEKNVIFFKQYVDSTELSEFIGAADVYVTPYLNETQITSGTLAQSFGAGKAVVSTPYWHANELLAEERGVLVPFGDSIKLADAICDILGNGAKRASIRKRAYQKGREMIWSSVAHQYVSSFEQARREHGLPAARKYRAPTMEDRDGMLPPWKFDHLLGMSDRVGIFQHAVFSVPSYRHGYCTDDNARALILMVLLDELGEKVPKKSECYGAYCGFLEDAFLNGRFRNFMLADRRWTEEAGSEDSHARALWALGVCVGRSEHDDLRGWAAQLFEKALPIVESFTSPRSWAFAILGLQEYLNRFAGDRRSAGLCDDLTDRLLSIYHKVATDDNWQWFEDIVAYDNARIPQALIESSRHTESQDALEVGLKTLRWLARNQVGTGRCFRPIGSRGFWKRGAKPAAFDQQPVEAQAMVGAALTAYRATGDPQWKAEASRAFDWFVGGNDLGMTIYDPRGGGCRDGLHVDRVNQNQGAESTLAYLLARSEMQAIGEVLS